MKDEISKPLRSRKGRYIKKVTSLKFFIYFLVAILVVFSFYLFTSQRYFIITIDQVEEQLPQPGFIENLSYELSLVAADINMYDYLSPSVRQEILDSLYGANKRFKVPIGLMHAVTRTESEYRFWIKHPTVTTKISGKMVTTNAVGMGGVIWEIWGDTLKYFNVAYNKSDLYLPGIGITAQACVLYLITDEVMKENTPLVNIVARIQTKYYGAYAKEYIARMKLVTSDLWIKRIAKEIDYVYNIEEEVVVDSFSIVDKSITYNKEVNMEKIKDGGKQIATN